MSSYYYSRYETNKKFWSNTHRECEDYKKDSNEEITKLRLEAIKEEGSKKRLSNSTKICIFLNPCSINSLATGQKVVEQIADVKP